VNLLVDACSPFICSELEEALVKQSGNMVNTSPLSAIRERIAVNSKFGQDQQNKDSVGKSGNIEHTRDRLKVSMGHFQSAIEKVNRKSKALLPT